MKINFTLKRTKNFNNICVAALNRQKETDGQGDRQADRQTRDIEEVARMGQEASCNSNCTLYMRSSVACCTFIDLWDAASQNEIKIQ